MLARFQRLTELLLAEDEKKQQQEEVARGEVFVIAPFNPNKPTPKEGKAVPSISIALTGAQPSVGIFDLFDTNSGLSIKHKLWHKQPFYRFASLVTVPSAAGACADF